MATPLVILQVEDRHEGLLWHVHLANRLHALLALSLLVEQPAASRGADRCEAWCHASGGQSRGR